MVQPRVLRLWLKYEVRFSKVRAEWARGAKSRKVAFHVNSTDAVTEAEESRSHQEAARRSRRSPHLMASKFRFHWDGAGRYARVFGASLQCRGARSGCCPNRGGKRAVRSTVGIP